MNECTSEAKRAENILGVVHENSDLAAEISISMGKLLEILVGPENEECGVLSKPSCLQEELVNQNIILHQINAKLMRVFETLNG